jgi:hypothetical protein
MFEYLQYFFNPAHIFTLRSPAMQPRAIIILAVGFGILILAAMVSKVLGRTNDGLKARGYTKLVHLFTTIGILGYVYLFFAWQGVVLLGGRFWLLILGLVFVVWLGFIIKYFITEVPTKRQEIEKRRQIEKYIP